MFNITVTLSKQHTKGNVTDILITQINTHSHTSQIHLTDHLPKQTIPITQIFHQHHPKANKISTEQMTNQLTCIDLDTRDGKTNPGESQSLTVGVRYIV